MRKQKHVFRVLRVGFLGEPDDQVLIIRVLGLRQSSLNRRQVTHCFVRPGSDYRHLPDEFTIDRRRHGELCGQYLRTNHVSCYTVLRGSLQNFLSSRVLD